MGGGVDEGHTTAEVTCEAAQAVGAAAGRAGDGSARARAKHPHLPVEPGESQCKEEEGQVQEKPLKAQRLALNKFTFRLPAQNHGAGLPQTGQIKEFEQQQLHPAQ